MSSTCYQMSGLLPDAIPFEPLISPQEHLDLLHPPTWQGRIALGPLTKTGICLDRDAALETVARFLGEPDVFISQQRFFRRRRFNSLANLGCCYVDLDYHKVPHLAELQPAVVTQEVLRQLGQQRVPKPSYIMFSGRGLLVVWLHDYLPKQAHPRWQAVQRQLLASLQPFGADANASDASRLFRLAGTRNSKSGKLVRPTYLPSQTRAGLRWAFEDLAREVLPVDRADLVERRKQRQPGKTSAGAVRLAGPCRSSDTYWRKVLEELNRLAADRWPNGIPSGSRDEVIFIVGCALAWIEPEPRLFSACRKWAEGRTPWSEAGMRLISTPCPFDIRFEARGVAAFVGAEGPLIWHHGRHDLLYATW